MSDVIDFDIKQCNTCPYSRVFGKVIEIQNLSEKKVLKNTLMDLPKNNNIEEDVAKKIALNYIEHKKDSIKPETLKLLGYKECYAYTGCTFGIEKKLTELQVLLSSKQKQINSFQKEIQAMQTIISDLEDKECSTSKSHQDELDMNQTFIEHLFKENEELEVKIQQLELKLKKVIIANNIDNVEKPEAHKVKKYTLRRIFLDILIESYKDMKEEQLVNLSNKEIIQHYFDNFVSLDLSFQIFKELQPILFGKDTITELNKRIFVLNNEEVKNELLMKKLSSIKLELITMLVQRGSNEKFNQALKQKIKPLCTNLQLIEINALLSCLFDKYSHLKT